MADVVKTSIDRFLSTLSADERQSLTSSSCHAPCPTDILSFTSAIDASLSSRKKTRRFGERFMPFLECLQQFGGAFDTLVQADPTNTASLVWGSSKILIQAVYNTLDYLDKISEMYLKLGSICPRLQTIQKIFPDEKGLRIAICCFFATVVDFCSATLGFVRSNGAKQFLRTGWTSFKSKFKDVETKLLVQREAIDLEVTIASEKAALRERQMASLYRASDEKKMTALVTVSQDQRIAKQEKIKEGRREKILSKITSHDHTFEFLRHREKRFDGTSATWFKDTAEFKKWANSDKSSVFWLHGIPGSGKSILSSCVIDDIARHRDASTSIAYFFCSFADVSSLNLSTILASLIKQIIVILGTWPPSLDSKLEELYIKQPSPPTTSELESLFSQALQLPRKIYCFVDGLDECHSDVWSALLKIIRRQVQDCKNTCKFFISSRTDTHAAEILPGFCVDCNLDTMRVDRPDIRHFINGRLREKLESRQLVSLSDTMIADIQDALVKGSGGMFLWVDLQIQDICRQNTEEDIRTLLQSLPHGIEETFQRILQRIVDENIATVAVKIFMWLATARRPLTLEELVEAISLQAGDRSHASARARFPIDPIKMIDNCRNLTVLNAVDRTVHFAHFTVKEYLMKLSSSTTPATIAQFYINDEEANKNIGQLCMSYLKFEDFGTQLTKAQQTPLAAFNSKSLIETTLKANKSSKTSRIWSAAVNILPERPQTKSLAIYGAGGGNKKAKSDVQLMRSKFSLVGYVCENWIHHCTRSPNVALKDETLRELVLETKTTSGFEYLPWKNNHDEIGTPRPYHKAFIWAVMNDNTVVLEFVLKDATDHSRSLQDTKSWYFGLNIPGKIGDIKEVTPLQFAAYKGYGDIVDVLRKHNCPLNHVSRNRDLPWVLALLAGHVDVSRKVLCEPNVTPAPAVSSRWWAANDPQAQVTDTVTVPEIEFCLLSLIWEREWHPRTMQYIAALAKRLNTSLEFPNLVDPVLHHLISIGDSDGIRRVFSVVDELKLQFSTLSDHVGYVVNIPDFNEKGYSRLQLLLTGNPLPARKYPLASNDEIETTKAEILRQLFSVPGLHHYTLLDYIVGTDWDSVELICSSGVDLSTIVKQGGMTVLEHVAKHFGGKVLKETISHGVNPSLPYANAVLRGDKPVIEALQPFIEPTNVEECRSQLRSTGGSKGELLASIWSPNKNNPDSSVTLEQAMTFLETNEKAGLVEDIVTAGAAKVYHNTIATGMPVEDVIREIHAKRSSRMRLLGGFVVVLCVLQLLKTLIDNPGMGAAWMRFIIYGVLLGGFVCWFLYGAFWAILKSFFSTGGLLVVLLSPLLGK